MEFSFADGGGTDGPLLGGGGLRGGGCCDSDVSLFLFFARLFLALCPPTESCVEAADGAVVVVTGALDDDGIGLSFLNGCLCCGGIIIGVCQLNADIDESVFVGGIGSWDASRPLRIAVCGTGYLLLDVLVE